MIAFYIAIAFAVGAALTALVIFGVPWLWGILKPYLHIWTAP